MCHLQLAQLRSTITKNKDLNAQLLAIDPHERWSTKYLLKEAGLKTDDVNIPLLMDPAQIVSAMYGVAFQMRIHVEQSNRPATFIIDQEGVLRYEKRATTFGDRPKPADIVQELSKLAKLAASGGIGSGSEQRIAKCRL